MSLTHKSGMEILPGNIINAKENGISIILPGTFESTSSPENVSANHTPGFIYKSSFSDELLTLDFEEYEKQVAFLNGLIPVSSHDKIFCTTNPGYFTAHTLSQWAGAQGNKIIYGEQSIHNTQEWKQQFESTAPGIWVATSPEVKLLLASAGELPSFLHTIIVINPYDEANWLPILQEKAIGKRIVLLHELDVLPGFSFYKDIKIAVGTAIPNTYTCTRPELWTVSKNGKKASILVKGTLTATAFAANRKEALRLSIPTNISARAQAGGFEITLPADALLLADGTSLNYADIRNSILAKNIGIVDVRIHQGNGLFPATVCYEAEDIIDDKILATPVAALTGLKKSVNRALLYSEQSISIDDSTLSVLSAYYSTGHEKIKLFFHTEFTYNTLPFPQLKQTAGEIKEGITADAPLALVEAPMPTIAADFSFTLTGHLQKLAATTHTITFVKQDGSDEVVSYSELLGRSAKIAGGLQKLDLPLQTPILIQLDDQSSWLTLYWAALLHRCIAAPLAVPKVFAEENDTVQKLKNIIGLLDNPVVVCDKANYDWYTEQFAAWGHTDIQVVAWEDIEEIKNVALPTVDPDDVALYMFTSGSTGLPKCIMQTHRALVFRSYSVGVHCGFTGNDIFLNWMPLDHIGGIQMSHNNAVVNGGSQVSIPTEYIISNPVRWLSLIDKYRASYTWSPNFAFGLLQQEADAIRNGKWDLSCMKHWLTGGESVSAFVTRDVIELLVPHGMSEHAVYPAYGMSETCSGITHAMHFDSVTMGLNHIVQSSMSGTLAYKETSSDDTVCLVEVGPPVPGVSIRITDRNGNILPENRIGLLQAKGPTITKGYLKNEEANAQLLPDGWFNTGDLGFIKNGVLTVTGREKDLIIINGLNYQNYEIERYIEELSEIGANGAIASSYFEPSKGREILYIFFKTGSKDYKEIATKVRNVLVRSIGIAPDVVVAVKEQDFLVTSSGKKRRPVQLDAYLQSQTVPLYDTSRINNAAFDSNLFFTDGWIEMPVTDSLNKQTEWWLVADDENISTYVKSASNFDSIYTTAGIQEYIKTAGADELKNVTICYIPNHTANENPVSFWVDEIATLKALFTNTPPASFLYVTHALLQQGSLQYGHIPGLLQSVAEELTETNIRWVDADGNNPATLHEQLCTELSDTSKIISVSWRGGKRYQQAVQPLTESTAIAPQTAIKQNGFYLITGGFGGVGSYLLRKLVEQYNIKALVIGRTDLDNKKVHASIFDFENKVNERLEVYNSLPQGSVIYRCCNIGDKAALQNIVEEVEVAEGQMLDGYFHLAGVAKLAYHWEHVEEHLFTTEDTRVFEWMLQSKVYGTINLEEIFDSRTNFLRVMFGSVNAYFGANSFSTYAAVNSFIRFYTEERNKQQGKGIHTIHWSQWKGLGMSEDNQLDMLSANRGYAAIEPAEGWKALQNILRLQPGNYISGLQPANSFIKNRTIFESTNETLYAVCDPAISNKALAGIEKLVKIPLSSWKVIKTKDEKLFQNNGWDNAGISDALLDVEEDSKPFTQLQEALAEIWRELLGIEKIKLTDNFFQLGGHSIKATRMIARVKDRFRMQLAFSALFKYPSLEELAAHIEEAKAEFSEFIIPQAPQSAMYALSPSQYRLWMVHKMEGGAGAYLVPGIYDIEGALDTVALGKALEALLGKHEILRTVFVEQDGRPYQKILDNVPAAEYFTYWDAETDIDGSINQLVKKGFNLDGGLLFHCHVFKVAADSYRMLVLLHHINADGVTLAVLRNDLVSFYIACVQQGGVQYDVPAIQYKDFSAWYNAFLQSEKAKELQQYWLNKFSGTLPVLDMPADYPRALRQSFKGSSVEIKLDAQLTAALETIANTHKLSLFAVLASMVKTILWRHSAQDDVIVGTSVDLRINSQLEAQAGQYVNVLPLRDKLDVGMTFAQLLQSVNDTLVNALEHKLYPFEKLVNELDLPRDTSRNPLFSILLVMHNFESNTDELTGTKWKPVHSDNDTSKFDYVFAFRKEADGLLINLRYCTDLFYKERAESLLNDINTLAQGVTADATCELKSYPLHISNDLLAQSIKPFAAPNFEDVITLFNKQSEAHPASIAVSYNGACMSYKELHSRAASYAALCNSIEGRRIVVAKSPSADWVAAILGIWMAGKTYIPVDISFPVAVIASQLKQVNPSAIIADADAAGAITGCIAKAELNKVPVYTSIPDAPFDTVNTTTNWTDEAYIVFTSGSTGIPKGIVGNRCSLSHFIHWEAQLLGLDKIQGVNISQLTQSTFDASFRDVFLALTTGNTVAIPAKKIRKDLVGLSQWLTNSNINIIHAVPSLLRAVLSNTTQGNSSLQYVLCAGEQLYKRDVDAVHEKWGNNVRVINLYGATETTLVKTYFDTSARWNLDALPVGKGMNDCNVLVLNEANILCAPGEAGEVFIRTPYISNGYLNVELNPASFQQNPLHNSYTDIVYKTGDAGRYTLNGDLQLKGRKDEQVKINGVRIELKEIEQAALGISGVSEAVAKAWDKEGAISIVLYYTSSSIDEATLQDKLKERLSLYAMPSSIVRLAQLPMNANGKVDKAALEYPVTIIASVAKEETFHPSLITAWSQSLKIAEGALDTSKDFFRSGGNSLLAMILLAKLQQAFGTRIPIEEFFRNPNLSFLQTFAPQEVKEEATIVKRLPKADAYALSHAQQRMWILNEMEPNNVTYNVKRSYFLSGSVNVEALKQSFENLLNRHETLRTSFHYQNGQVVQVVHDTYNIDSCFIYKDISAQPVPDNVAQEQVEAFIAEPFRLDTYPLIRILLLKTSADKWGFALVKHHIVSDGWSMEVVAKELIDGYNHFAKEKKFELATLPFQYKDYAAWQNEYLTSKELSADEQYWLNKLGNLPEPLELPYDRPRFSVKTFNGDLHKFSIDATLSQKLRQFSEGQQATVFMVVLTALKTLLFRYTGKTDIIVGIPTAGRRIPGVEEQVGFYVNTLALRTALDTSDSFAALLQKVKKTTLEGLDHQDYPFDTLIDKLNLEKRMDHSPLFDVVMQFMNTSVAGEKQAVFEGLNVEPFEAKWQTSQFDLNFFFTETEAGIQGLVEYNTDLFEKSTVVRQVQHLNNILSAIVDDTAIAINAIGFLTEEEQAAHKALLSTNAAYPHHTVCRQFDIAVAQDPSATALITTKGNTTYGQLKENADKLATLLSSISKGKNINIALLMDEGPEAITSMFASLKSGCCYVPVAATVPYERMKYLVSDSESVVLLFSKKYLKEAGKLYWECEQLQHAICIDSDDILHEVESAANIMSEELWDFVGQSATDDITGGAWFSSYTGLPISRIEMDEYAQNAGKKLQPYLNKNTRILEVGCSSAITMSVIAPQVQHYTGTDLSANILEIAKRNLANADIANYDLVHAAAHDVCKNISGKYDVLIFNSVIQCFSGYNYFRNVIESLLPFMADKAVIFFGDIQDLDKKDALVESLTSYAVEHPHSKVKLDWSQELFIPKRFFEELDNYFPEIATISHSNKIATVENELTLFRYDTIAELDKTTAAPTQTVKTWYDKSDIAAAEPQTIFVAELETPAYIIYTSGSTGNPKGCIITHHNLIRLFFNDKFPYTLSEKDVWIQSHGYHFDFSVWEIYGPLLTGASLILPTREEIRDISTYYNLLKQHKITVLNNTPRAFYNFSQYVLQGNDPHDISAHLRYVMIGGEKLQLDRLQAWMERFPSVEIVNMYGITETTVHVTFFPVHMKDVIENPYASVIGKPIPECTVYLKDEFGNDVPFNVAAEMNVGGTGVGLGYYNRPQLSNERFVDNMYGDGQKIYRSGDFARLQPDGNLVYINRRDAQVKIRGYRIETGEIEAILLKHPDVKQAAVVVKADKSGDNALYAYYTGQQAEEDALRKYLSMHVPSYMVPSAFIFLAELPVTINGKLDVRKLPDPETATGEGEAINLEDLTPSEQAVMAAFCEVLNRTSVGLKDNFFDMGGHSLKAMNLMSLLHGRVKVGVPLVYLYKFPTVKDIAYYIDSARYMNIQYKEHPYLLLGNPQGKRSLILFPPALGSALAYSHLASLLDDTRLYSFNYVDSNDTMQNYVRLLNEIQPTGDLYIAGHSAGGFMAFHVAKAMEKAGRKVGGIIILDAFRQGKEGKYHSRETIMEGVGQYLDYKFEEFKDHFIDMEFFKEVCYNQVRQYYDFLYHAEQEGDIFIQAPIHFMVAENNYERQENWTECTAGGVKMYYAKGIHGKMVDEPWVRPNAEMLNNIIKQQMESL